MYIHLEFCIVFLFRFVSIFLSDKRKRQIFMDNPIKSIKIDHDSFIALHVQLLNQLRQLILSGRWQKGDRLPSESKLVDHLGISRTTVRIALQSAEVEGLIRRAAGRGTFVDYTPDELTTKRSIGYVTRSFHSDLHRVLLSSVETELRSSGYRVFFSNAGTNDEEAEVLGSLLEDIDGLILWPNVKTTPTVRDTLNQLAEQGIPIVFIDRLIEGINADFVSTDNFGGTAGLTRHLIELGHEDIVFLQGNISKLYSIDERYRGYEFVMQESGLDILPVWKVNSPNETEFVEVDIYRLLSDMSDELTQQIQTLFEQTPRKPTAIIGANDALAILAMKAIEQLNLNVPEDISIVGFDDISLAAHMHTPLTTVSQDAHEIGVIAAQLLMSRLDGNTASLKHEVVPARMQIRSSTSIPLKIT